MLLHGGCANFSNPLSWQPQLAFSLEDTLLCICSNLLNVITWCAQKLKTV